MLPPSLGLLLRFWENVKQNVFTFGASLEDVKISGDIISCMCNTRISKTWPFSVSDLKLAIEMTATATLKRNIRCCSGSCCPILNSLIAQKKQHFHKSQHSKEFTVSVIKWYWYWYKAPIFLSSLFLLKSPLKYDYWIDWKIPNAFEFCLRKSVIFNKWQRKVHKLKRFGFCMASSTVWSFSRWHKN